MKRPNRLLPTLAAATVAAGGLTGILAGGPAGAASPVPGAGGPGGAVFVQTDNVAGNQVVAYLRGADGQLTPAGTYGTGGLGGVLAGSVVDHTASQGSLVYDAGQHLLYAVNAGSDTVSVFSVLGDRLALRQVISSGGAFPVSVAVHGLEVDVLNAEDGGSVQGYVSWGGRLVALPGSARALGLDPTATPQFVNTPGQVAFTPDGSQLVVTTKANGSDIDVFGVGFLGYLSSAPVVNPEPGAVPFGVTFRGNHQLVVAEAGTDALSTFGLGADGTLTPVSTVATGQAATCWVAAAQGFYFVSNAGSGTVSRIASTFGGQLSLLGNTGTDPGTVDAAATPDGRYLYVQTGGNGIVDGYQVGGDGSLTPVGSVTVPDAVGGEGIAVS